MARREPVLVACPDREILDRLGEEITGCGRRPLLTRDGESALRLAIESEPSAALVDADLGTLDGHLLVRRLRRIPGLRTMPIVLIARGEGDEHAQLARTAGADDSVPRGSDPEGIAQCLRRCMEAVAGG